MVFKGIPSPTLLNQHSKQPSSFSLSTDFEMLPDWNTKLVNDLHHYSNQSNYVNFSTNFKLCFLDLLFSSNCSSVWFWPNLAKLYSKLYHLLANNLIFAHSFLILGLFIQFSFGQQMSTHLFLPQISTELLFICWTFIDIHTEQFILSITPNFHFCLKSLVYIHRNCFHLMNVLKKGAKQYLRDVVFVMLNWINARMWGEFSWCVNKILMASRNFSSKNSDINSWLVVLYNKAHYSCPTFFASIIVLLIFSAHHHGCSNLYQSILQRKAFSNGDHRHSKGSSESKLGMHVYKGVCGEHS